MTSVFSPTAPQAAAIASALPPSWLDPFASCYDVTDVRLVSCAGKLRGPDATITASIAVEWVADGDADDVAHTATLIARWQGGWYETDGTTDVPAYVARKVDEWLAKEGK